MRVKRFWTLLKNEVKLSIRDMNMLIFALSMPLAVLVILGILYGSRPAFEGAAYSFVAQSFGALCAIAICAGGLMGLPLVVADYRERRILKRFRVTPASPALLLGVELTVYVLYCAASLVLLAAVAVPVWGVRLTGSLPAFLGAWALTMLSTLSIGLMVGALAKNSRQAGVIASLLYFPMLVFSGTTLPVEVMPAAMQRIVGLFPLTQGLTLMKQTFLGLGVQNVLTPVAVMTAVTLVCSALAVRFFRWE